MTLYRLARDAYNRDPTPLWVMMVCDARTYLRALFRNRCRYPSKAHAKRYSM